jgi:hypothetical protein
VPTTAWDGLKAIEPETYQCGWCGLVVSSDVAIVSGMDGYYWSVVVICPNCDRPTFIGKSSQRSSVVDHIMPKSLSGTSLSGLPPDIEPLWAEIRRAAAEGSPTLAVMGCRKMLMHLAAGAAKEDGEDDPSFESFWSAAEYLKNNNWFPKRAPDIGHIIREAGNDVNHEVVMSDDSEAEVVILFTEAVLRTMYHYPAQVGELDQPPTE